MAVENIADEYFSIENYMERISNSKRIVIGVYFDKVYSIAKIDGIIEVLEFQRINNDKLGYGYLTNEEVEKRHNEAAGYGAYTNEQLDKQRSINNANGLGEITDSEVNIQKDENNKAGYGLFTDTEIQNQRFTNARCGLGSITDSEVENLKKSLIDEIDKLKKNKQTYQVFRKYSDLADIERSQGKESEATSTFNTMKSVISMGRPGIGTFDDFELHDEWIALLKEVEKYHSKRPVYLPYPGRVIKSKTDMVTKTFTYNVTLLNSDDALFNVVKTGFSNAYDSNWKDIPKEWPEVSIYTTNLERRRLLTEAPAMVYEPVSSYLLDGIPMIEVIIKKSTIVDGYRKKIQEANDRFDEITDPWQRMGFAYAVGDTIKNMEADVKTLSNSSSAYISALPLFSTALSSKNYGYSIILKIEDKNGKVLVKGSKQNLDFDKGYNFDGITSEISNLIENNEISVKVDSVYLKYGKVDSVDNIYKLPEIKIEY